MPTAESSGRLLFAITGLLCALVRADSQPAAFFGQYTLGGGFNGADQVQGWEFVPRSGVTVVQVGLYDGRLSGGFQQAHTVAIWDSSGALITSAFIPQGVSARLQNNFRYVDVPPVTLGAGESYVIGAFYSAPVTDYTVVWERVALANGIVGFDPRIEFAAYRAGSSPGQISFPQSRWTDYVGGFGPNFILEIPEPSAVALLLLGIVMVAASSWFDYAKGTSAQPKG